MTTGHNPAQKQSRVVQMECNDSHKNPSQIQAMIQHGYLSQTNSNEPNDMPSDNVT